MRRVVQVVVPARLGRGFRWLLAASWVSNLGDGLALAAGPLLVASQTREPFLVALAVLLQQLPWLLFGLHAGWLADRVDRRLLVVAVDVVRAAFLVVLCLSIVTGAVSVAVVLVALFLVATAEVFADSAAMTLLPMVVPRSDLGLANARLQTGHITVNQLAGPPIGAVLFAAGAVWPFAAQAVLISTGALLVSRVVLPAHVPGQRSRGRGRGAVWRDIAEGLRWVQHHPAVRTLVVTVLLFNVTYGAAWSVLVLYVTGRLGMGELGFGLVTTVMAVGGLLGTLSYGWITRHVSLADLMRVGLVVETLTHLVLALTTHRAVALVVFFAFGAHAFVWGTTAVTIRQRAVPSALQGRVGAIDRLGHYGGMVVGSALGGVIAQRWGVVAPFWFGFVGSAVFLLVVWRSLRHVAHGEDAAEQPNVSGA
jgi:predicted MFS family arabinose efflux permease